MIITIMMTMIRMIRMKIIMPKESVGCIYYCRRVYIYIIQARHTLIRFAMEDRKGAAVQCYIKKTNSKIKFSNTDIYIYI